MKQIGSMRLMPSIRTLLTSFGSSDPLEVSSDWCGIESFVGRRVCRQGGPRRCGKTGATSAPRTGRQVRRRHLRHSLLTQNTGKVRLRRRWAAVPARRAFSALSRFRARCVGSEQDRPVGPIDIRIAPHRLIPTNITSPTARLLVGDNERAGPDRNSMHTRSTSRPNFYSVPQTGAVGGGGQESQKQIQSSTEDAESAPTL